MASTTLNMLLTKPLLDGDPGTWDTSLNASLDRLDIHDHTTNLGVKVPTAGLNINADLTFAGFAATNNKAVKFTAQTPASMTSYNGSIFLGTDNEFYLRSPAGTNIKVTSSGTLNMSLVGGIAGDYAAAAASLYYDDANQTYRFLEAAPLPNNWSRVACGDLDLYEHASGITNRVRLASPAALAGSYTVTWPAAVPAATSYLQMSSAGVLTASNGHGDRALFINAIACQVDTAWTVSDTVIVSTGSGYARWAPELHVGDQLKSVAVVMYGNGAADAIIDVLEVPTDGSAPTTRGTTTVTDPSATVATQTLNFTDFTITTGRSAVIRVNPNAAGIGVYSLTLTYDRPA